MKTASHSVDQLAVPCTIMRGGTSKGVFFLESDLPADPQSRERVLLEAIGSPDPRQIDGLGRRRHADQQDRHRQQKQRTRNRP